MASVCGDEKERANVAAVGNESDRSGEGVSVASEILVHDDAEERVTTFPDEFEG